MPASLAVDGTGRAPRGEDDWFALPPLVADGTVSVEAEGDVTLLGLSDGQTELRFTPDPVTGLPTSPPLAMASPWFLRVTATGPYRVSLSGDPLPPAVASTDLPVDVTLTPEVGDVAGFWTEAQRVPATLEVASGAAVDLALTLDAVASDADWTVELPSEPATVPAGGTVAVPVTIVVPPDAATDIPVTVTVRARDDTGAQATAATDVTPRLGADPVGPTTTWPLPDALLGGLDVASTALGGALVTPVDPVGEASAARRPRALGDRVRRHLPRCAVHVDGRPRRGSARSGRRVHPRPARRRWRPLDQATPRRAPAVVGRDDVRDGRRSRAQREAGGADRRPRHPCRCRLSPAFSFTRATAALRVPSPWASGRSSRPQASPRTPPAWTSPIRPSEAMSPG